MRVQESCLVNLYVTNITVAPVLSMSAFYSWRLTAGGTEGEEPLAATNEESAWVIVDVLGPIRPARLALISYLPLVPNED